MISWEGGLHWIPIIIYKKDSEEKKIGIQRVHYSPQYNKYKKKKKK
jgi:hypothetical protein